MDTVQPPQLPPFSALRQFVGRKAEGHRCDLCGKALEDHHEHLVEPANRKLLCACNECTILLSGRQDGRYRRVPHEVTILDNFRMSDELWQALHVPIDLVFFFTSSQARRVMAFYPSPAGATESLLSLEAWRDLVRANPILDSFQPDVEALLVYRVGTARAYYRAPIDECYKLVGLIRTHWRGFSGSPRVWQEIGRFFEELQERARASGGRADA